MIRKFILILLICVASTVLTSGNIIAESLESTVRQDLKELEREQEQIEKLMSTVHETLVEKGLGKLGFSYDDSKRIIHLQHFKNETKEQFEEEMNKTITSIAEEIGLEGVKVQWNMVDKHLPELSKEEKESQDIFRKIMEKIQSSLINEGYKVVSISLSQQQVNIQISASEDIFNNIKSKVKQIAKESIASITEKNFDVHISRKTEQEKTEEEWNSILFTVNQLVEKKFEEYRGFAYSFHPEPLQIIIKTELKKPFWVWRWLSDYDEKVEEIVSYVDEVIKVTSQELGLKEIPYEIIIRSKDNERLN